MRKFAAGCAILLALMLTLTPATPVAGQGPVYRAEPPIVVLEISGNEPLPPDGVAKLVVFGGRGGGGGEDTPRERVLKHYNPTGGPYWLEVPQFGPGTWAACGFTRQPTARLTTPDGQQQDLRVSKVEYPPTHDGCYSGVTLSWQRGMAFGLHRLTVERGGQSLSHEWAVDYPACRQGVQIEDSDYWLMGLPAGQNLSISFYRYDGKTGDSLFVANRSASVGEDGVLYMRVRVARSAPFTLQDLTFVILNPNKTLIFSSAGDDPGLADAYRVAEAPRPTYRGYDVRLPGGYFGPAFDLMPLVYSPTLSCSNAYARFVQIRPRGGGPLLMYAEPSATSRPVTPLDNGAVADVLEHRAVLDSGTGRATLWLRLRGEDGAEGWATGDSFLGADPNGPQAGMMAEILPVGFDERTGRDSTASVYLRSQPTTAVPIEGEVKTGERVRLISQFGDWWYVETGGGQRGWLPARVPGSGNIDWVALESVVARFQSVEGINVPAITEPYCPNSPVSRLRVGMKGRVTPGDPNNLRETPGGKVTGKIPGGGQFEVFEGPLCSGKGLTYWLVGGDDGYGWTAEGEKNTYWLEPLN